MTDSERTLPATPRRREAARREGLMPPAAAPAWAASAATAILLGPAWLRATVPAGAEMLRAALPTAHAPEWPGLAPAALLLPTAGLVLATAAAGLATRALLDGFAWHPGRVAPDPRRVDPLRGLARILSWRSLLASLGHAIGLAVLVAVAVRAAEPLAAIAASGAAFEDPALLVAAAWRPLAWLAAAAAAVALVHWGLARRRFEASIRMTPQDFADEVRGMRADPQVRLLQWRRVRPPVRRPVDGSEPRPAPGSRSAR